MTTTKTTTTNQPTDRPTNQPTNQPSDRPISVTKLKFYCGALSRNPLSFTRRIANPVYTPKNIRRARGSQCAQRTRDGTAPKRIHQTRGARSDQADDVWLCLCNNNRSTAVATRNTRVCGLRTSSRQERPPAGRSPCPKTSSTPGSAAKAVHAVTELEDLFNGPSSMSREDAVSYDQLHVPISLPGDPMAME